MELEPPGVVKVVAVPGAPDPPVTCGTVQRNHAVCRALRHASPKTVNPPAGVRTGIRQRGAPKNRRTG